jgi:hypothetical protein
LPVFGALQLEDEGLVRGDEYTPNYHTGDRR